MDALDSADGSNPSPTDTYQILWAGRVKEKAMKHSSFQTVWEDMIVVKDEYKHYIIESHPGRFLVAKDLPRYLGILESVIRTDYVVPQTIPQLVFSIINSSTDLRDRDAFSFTDIGPAAYALVKAFKNKMYKDFYTIEELEVLHADLKVRLTVWNY